MLCQRSDRPAAATGTASKVEVAWVDKFVEGCASNFPLHLATLGERGASD
jgi:hypothetical protein